MYRVEGFRVFRVLGFRVSLKNPKTLNPILEGFRILGFRKP